MRVRIELKPADLWVGAFWRNSGPVCNCRGTLFTCRDCGKHAWDLWICLVPCLPIHFTWVR